ncbi:hypothetical protein Ade02nite_81500 [Paractinoplanes deccanensis]|uniref:Tail specific protease domain-containing protein n=1 Tax=Paractinoplanes deccanensis TaxID=113561 RepID=A0ABQ3YHM0_9ACTN|nr:hypothetical protein [Actinoplanes deccanensis]GID79509.1 hypothetical protein Ade02nite_81500 [Actinoplanes deccanensis]
MPAGPRLDKLLADLAPLRHTPVTPAELEAVCQRTVRHLELHVDPESAASPDEEPPGWPPADPEAVRRKAAGLTSVSRRDDGTCTIKIDSLEPLPLALPYLDAAFTLARHAPALILDLSDNGGGDPATVAAIAGWLLGETTRPLSEVIYRDRRRQWWPRTPRPT